MHLIDLLTYCTAHLMFTFDLLHFELSFLWALNPQHLQWLCNAVLVELQEHTVNIAFSLMIMHFVLLSKANQVIYSAFKLYIFSSCLFCFLNLAVLPNPFSPTISFSKVFDFISTVISVVDVSDPLWPLNYTAGMYRIRIWPGLWI